MRIVYLHHSERGFTPGLSNQKQDLTKRGVKLAKLVAQGIENLNIDVIYTGAFKRHIQTAQILNKKLNVEIIIEPRFNELGDIEGEKQFTSQFFKRNIDAIEDIIEKYKDSDKTVLCISSGVNINAFIFHYYNINYDDNTKWINHNLLAPLIFRY